MILSLDLGLSCGWACAPRGTIGSSGTWRLSEGDRARAYAALREELLSDVTRGDVSLIAYEDVPAQTHSGGDAAHFWGGLEGVVLTVCAETSTRYLGVKPAQWKRAAGLRSATGPAEALVAAKKRWPEWTFTSEDEAVARWVGVFAMGRIRNPH